MNESEFAEEVERYETETRVFFQTIFKISDSQLSDKLLGRSGDLGGCSETTGSWLMQ